MSAVEQILNVAEKHGRYPVEAYVFIFEILEWIDFAIKKKHLTGRELALAAYAFSIEKYGLLARTIWEEMHLQRSEDLGQIVFHLVEEGLMGKQDSDKVEDFDNVFDLTAFDKTSFKIEDDAKPKQRIATSSLGSHMVYEPPSELKLKSN